MAWRAQKRGLGMGWALAIPMCGAWGRLGRYPVYHPPGSTQPAPPRVLPTPADERVPEGGTLYRQLFWVDQGDSRVRYAHRVIGARRGLCRALPATLRPLLSGPSAPAQLSILQFSVFLSISQYSSVSWF